MRVRWVAVVVFTSLLAGCSERADPGSDVPTLVWDDTYRVYTTPLEPFDLVGGILVSWDGDTMRAFVENEDAMARHYLRENGVWYATIESRGWTRYDDRDAVEASSPRAHRLLTWDLPDLLDDAEAVEVTGSALVTETTVLFQGREETVKVTATLEGSRVVEARVDTPFDAESPYTIERDGAAMPLAGVPAESKTPAEVSEGDGVARAGHARIIGWIQDHLSQTGTLPEEVTPESLALQRLGAAWPENPYGAEPMQDKDASGHFIWNRCSDQDATYEGLGWDLSPIGEAFGRGCTGST